jgi:hypothetical protein
MKPTRFQEGLEGLEAEAISRTGQALRRMGQLTFQALQRGVDMLEDKAPRAYAALVGWLDRHGYFDEKAEAPPVRIAVPSLPPRAPHAALAQRQLPPPPKRPAKEQLDLFK